MSPLFSLSHVISIEIPGFDICLTPDTINLLSTSLNFILILFLGVFYCEELHCRKWSYVDNRLSWLLATTLPNKGKEKDTSKTVRVKTIYQWEWLTLNTKQRVVLEKKVQTSPLKDEVDRPLVVLFPYTSSSVCVSIVLLFFCLPPMRKSTPSK